MKLLRKLINQANVLSIGTLRSHVESSKEIFSIGEMYHFMGIILWSHTSVFFCCKNVDPILETDKRSLSIDRIRKCGHYLLI